MELGVVGAVVVGRARLQEAELGAPAGEQLGLLARVGDVEDLDAVHPQPLEAVDAVQDFVGVGDVPEGVGPDATPPASWIASTASATVGVARIRKAGLPSIRYPRIRAPTSPMSSSCQPVGVRGGGQHRRRQVGTADRFTRGDPLPDLRFVELEPGLLERLGHPQRPLLAVGEELRQPLGEPGPVWSML